MMKSYLLVAVTACSLLAAGAPAANAAGKKMSKAECAEMMNDKDNRMMFMHEMMSTKERKMEMAKMLKADKEFNQIYGNLTTGGG
jgi:hypothetical protein